MLLSIHGIGQQTVKFSGDSLLFGQELTSFFRNVPAEEQKLMEPVLTDFFSKWTGARFNDDKKKIIYAVCNEMSRKKLRPFPDFFGYIAALTQFVNSSQPESRFIPWSTILLKLLEDKNSRKYVAFQEFSSYLFTEKLLYKSATTRWKFSDDRWTFQYDSVPSVRFNETSLTCLANDDSLNIYSTGGIYYPLTFFWYGNGGKVDWRRAGEEPTKVFATLKRYRVQTRFSNFTADSVLLTHKKFFAAPLEGKYTDKVLADVTEEKASYPRFYSYNKRIGINRLFENIDFLGGFALEGSKVIGSGDRDQDAHLYFKKGGRNFVTAGADIFVIRPDRINASAASVTIYHEDDSIFHPGLQFKYLDESKELSLTKDERIARVSPWYDSYHKAEIYCEAFYWKMGDSLVSFQAMKGLSKEGKAVFESSSYYSMPRYEKLQGIDEQNPLMIIKRYTEKKKDKSFTLQEMTEYMNIPAEQIENQLLNLAIWGFLVYDSDKKTAIVKQKLYDYVNAYNGKTDYDGIYFNSFVTNASNGLLNLETFDLHIKGVEKVVLSDSQTVQIFPANKEVVLKKGLDFLFTGRIEAGLFDFYARDCAFQYSKFKLNMPVIDSMTFYVFGKKIDPKTGKYSFNRIKTAITNLGGTLLIDDPLNKAGLKRFPQYPVFTNTKDAYVYWDKPTIQKGVYNKDRFYYQVNPFKIDHLDDLSPDTLKFAGVLNSAGILPDLHEPLLVRPDYSLGIVKQTDANGLPVYGGKGALTARIELSQKGLRSNGTLKCLSSETVSDDFLFLPDSMKTVASHFTIAEQVAPAEFPAVTGDTVRQFWVPAKDSLAVQTISKPLAMFRDQSKFSGLVALSPSKLIGDGTIRIRDAEMDSRRFNFRSRTFDALIANFRIKSYDLAALSISTKNYQTLFNFDTRKGEFKSNVGISQGEFPVNQYVCSMDRFDWLIDNEEIMLTNEMKLASRADTLDLAQLIDIGYTGSEFVSVHPLQDSLKFFAARARYNLKTNVINAEDVRIIKVADAAIYPDSGKLVIQKNAVMKPLARAMIIANTRSKYHQFYHAGVSIASRKQYTARGDYDYIDRKRTRQTIHFSSIKVDSAGQTVAQGSISDSANFLLSPEFAFMGAVNLKAGTKELWFDGGFHPVTTCFTETPQWVRFESSIDPDKVRIPLANPLKNTAHEPITSGILFRNTESRIAPSFLRPRISFSDSLMATAEGFIEYNVPTSEFRIGSSTKLEDITTFGPYLSLNTWNCKMRGEGKLNLSLNTEMLKIKTYGMMDYFIIPDSTLIRCALSLDFPLYEPALQRCSDQFNAINLPGIQLLGTQYKNYLENTISKDEADRLKGEIELMGRFRKLPEELEKTIMLADVVLYWDSTTKSYRSVGNIGLAAVGKNQVNKTVKGRIEFTKKRNGDELTVYLELTETDWYYFNYRNRVMSVLSSDLNFNDKIREGLQSGTEMKRVKEVARGYSYALATERKKREFLRKFEPVDSE
jgi:hypothetical protein